MARLVISNASCTTNCLAPVAYVLDKTIGIEKGLTTIHSLYRRPADPSTRCTRTFNRGRGAVDDPDPTGGQGGGARPCPSSTASSTAWRSGPDPERSGRGLASSSPEIDLEEINEAIKAAAEGELKGHARLHHRAAGPRTSTMTATPRSSMRDQTKVMDGTLVRVMSWYDNEWGFEPDGRHGGRLRHELSCGAGLDCATGPRRTRADKR